MKMMKAIKLIWFFFWGKLFSLIYYDKKYLRGKYFCGKFAGLTAPGWTWAACDGASRLFLRSNIGIPWPASYKVAITHPENIIFDPDDLHIFHTFGTYFQAIDAKIYTGKGLSIVPNVGLITANHNIKNLSVHSKGKI